MGVSRESTLPVPAGPGLDVRDVVVTLGGRCVVDGVSFSVAPGEVLGLVGPNGAGKTSCFRYLAGLVPGQGALLLNQVPIAHQPLNKRALLGLSYVPQGPSVFPHLSCRENLLAVAELRLPRRDRLARILEVEGWLSLNDIADQRAGRLSGGERRRLEVARAILPAPVCLLLDEPFAALDPHSVDELSRCLRALVQRGLCVVIADHRVEAVLACADRVMVMVNGQILSEGSPEAIAQDPRASSMYLGKAGYKTR